MTGTTSSLPEPREGWRAARVHSYDVNPDASIPQAGKD
jgi:hypothetical protein